MSPLAWSALLMVLAIALIFLELFIPSGGVLSFLSLASVVASVVLAYLGGGPLMGTFFLAFAVVGVPAMAAAALRWWPHTPLGRMVVIHPPKPEEILPNSEEVRQLKGLKGKLGRAKSPMLPAGVVVVDGRRVDAVSEGAAIDAGQKVEVVDVKGNHVVVRPVDESHPAWDENDDILSQPIDRLGLEPFDDPLG